MKFNNIKWLKQFLYHKQVLMMQHLKRRWAGYAPIGSARNKRGEFVVFGRKQNFGGMF